MLILPSLSVSASLKIIIKNEIKVLIRRKNYFIIRFISVLEIPLLNFLVAVQSSSSEMKPELSEIEIL